MWTLLIASKCSWRYDAGTVIKICIANALLVPLLLCPIARPQTPADSKWSVTIAEYNTPERKEPNCHPLQYFLDSNKLKEFDYGGGLLGPYPQSIEDRVQSERRGEVNGFVIYDVIHDINDGGENVPGENFPYPRTILKMVLAERQPGEFCEIYHEQGDKQGLILAPPYFVEVDSEKVLVTRDRESGTGNFYNEAYWTFDKDGPILLALSVIEKAVAKLLPPGMAVNKGGGFKIESLSYDMPVWQTGDPNCCPSGGSVHMGFALKDHKLIVVSEEYKGLAPVISAQAKTKINPKDGLTYVRIPAGTFHMGCSDGDSECVAGAPSGNTGGNGRVVRGASWSDAARYVRVSYRYAYRPDTQDVSIGFRCAGN